MVDAHNLLRTTLSHILNECSDIEVVSQAGNGKEFLDALNNLATPVPDICLLDIAMPFMNGYDTVTALKKQHPHIGVIVLTELCNDYSILRMLNAGANAYIKKSVEQPILTGSIREVYRSGFYYTDAVPQKLFAYAAHQTFPPITGREKEYLELCCTNLRHIEIAEKMGISTRTVEDHYNSISKKLNVDSRLALVIFALSAGMIYFQ